MPTPKTPPKQKADAEPKVRQLKPRSYKSFRLAAPIKPAMPQLPSAFKLFIGSLAVLKQHWKPFLGIVLVYGVLNIIFVKGFGAGADLGSIKDSLTGSGNTFNEVLASSTLFVYLIGSSGNATSDTAGIAQVIITLIGSLAIVWALRQVYANKKIAIRDAFYSGMYPLIPYILVVIVIILQLVPLAVAAFLFGTIIAAGGQGVEVVAWSLVLFLAALLSLYMVASSLFALYIVCLPDMRPLTALRSSRALVRYRRWTVIRKILFLPLALLVLAAVVTVPVIIFLPAVASWLFFVVSMVGIVVSHSYGYRLYRELL